MPFTVPSSGGRGRSRRPRTQRPVQAVRGRNLHSPNEAENLDRIASLGTLLDEPIGVTAEILTITDLLAFASSSSSTATAQISPDLLAPSFQSPGGDSSYVAGAQAETGDNPARSDLDGLAPNTYFLKQAVAQAFGISPSGIGGRAYRPYKSDHTTGHAIDIPGAGPRGDVIADWVIARAADYKVKYIIFNRRIWYPGKGWRPYNPSSAVQGFASDAYHLHHVHVSTY